MSWVKKLGERRYKAYWRDPEGRQRSKTFTKKRDAEDFLDKVGVNISEGMYIDPTLGKVKFGVYYETFLDSSELRPSSRDRYERHYRLYLGPAFGHRRLSSITPSEVRAWKTALTSEGIGASTIASALRLIKAVFNRAVADDIIGRSPARNVANPSPDPAGGMRVLEASQVAQLAAAIDDRHRALILLLAYRGPRIGEAAALRVGDLDLMRGRMTISKTLTEVAGRLEEGPPKTEAGVRTVTLPAFLRDGLTEHLAAFSEPNDPNAYVFTMAGGGPGRKEGDGGPIRANNFRKRAFAHAVRDAGLNPNLTPHDLRDTAATLAFQAGATVKEVSVMLGHANPAVTLRVYTGILNSMSEQTDERLDAAFRAAAPVPSAEVVQLAR